MLLLPETKKTIACWIIALALPLIVIPPVYLCTDFYLSNCCVIIGVIYLGVLGLLFVARQGFFDLFGYQCANWISSFRKGAPKKYKDIYTYKEIKKEKRRTTQFIWLPFLLVGAVLIILSIILAYYLI